MAQKDTICAVATAFGNAGVAVIRISGTKSLVILKKIFQPKRKALFLSHKMYLGKITTGQGTVIDEVLAVFFQSPKSFTGEDCAEIHCHGGYITAQKILKRVQTEARLAEPGEFTKRAFLNGKIDLVQAEAIADIIYAKSDKAQEIAQAQLEGSLGTDVRKILKNVLEVYFYLATEIDFPDEEIPEMPQKELARRVSSALAKTSELIKSAGMGAIYKEGVRVAIVGLPNAGKSSLLNALTKDSKAIVTEIPGTTRDVLESQIEVGGILFRLFDTAGITDTEDVIEKEGVRRSLKTLETANLVLLVVEKYEDIEKFEKHLRSKASRAITDKEIILVRNKIDKAIEKKSKNFKKNTGQVFRISAKKGTGIKNLEEGLLNTIKKESSKQAVYVTSLRQKELLVSVQNALQRALGLIKVNDAEDKILADLDEARRSLEAIIGQNTSLEMTEKVFSRFCVGK